MSVTPVRWWATLSDVWTCVYPGCGASFDSYVAMAGHLSSHYS